jgi:hypothetical protein
MDAPALSQALVSKASNGLPMVDDTVGEFFSG